MVRQVLFGKERHATIQFSTYSRISVEQEDTWTFEQNRSYSVIHFVWVTVAWGGEVTCSMGFGDGTDLSGSK